LFRFITRSLLSVSFIAPLALKAARTLPNAACAPGRSAGKMHAPQSCATTSPAAAAAPRTVDLDHELAFSP
jgi:hypothetical protein